MKGAKAMSEVRKLEPALPPASTLGDLVAHELAALMPMIEGQEFLNLKADIKRNGIQEPIRLFQGKILDGRNRCKAAKELEREGGFTFKASDFKEFTGTVEDAEAYVIPANFQRRQMSNKQKAEVVAKMIAKYPEASNRKIAALCSLTHAFVGTVKEKLTEPERKSRKEFDEVCRVFNEWDDKYRVEFVKKFTNDIREILASA
jgi:molecular chaperone DnaK (HSP70)